MGQALFGAPAKAYSALFTPASLSNGAFWFRAKDNGVNGSSVATWVDQLGYGRNGIATGTAPTVITGQTTAGGKAVAYANVGSHRIQAPLDTGDVATYLFSSELTAEPAINAFDGSTATKWSSNATTTGHLGFRLKTAKVVTQYTVTGYGGNQDAKNWDFQGSNDGSSWTTLDSRTNITFSGTTSQAFSFSNSTGYLYYRLNVTANNGNSTYLSITALAMTGVTSSAPTAAEIWAVLYTTTTGALNGLWQMNRGTNGSAHALYPYSGNVYETFGVVGPAAASFATASINIANGAWRLYRVTNDGTNLRTYVDNVLASTQTVVGLGGAQWPLVARLGATVYSSTNVANWTGRIAEVFARTSISDSTDIANLIAYVNAEHGLTIP